MATLVASPVLAFPPASEKGLYARTAEPGGGTFGPAEIRSDFNSDGYSDLAIGVAGERHRGFRFDPGAGEGGVVILYGSSTGLTATGSQSWTQASDGIAYTEHGKFNEDESGDNFGQALATGDFNDDGFADLAIGARGEHPIDDRVREPNATGAVHILYGSPSGLRGSKEIRWPDDSGVEGNPVQFGSALASGDFDGNGLDDLAITSAWSIDWYGTEEAALWVSILSGTRHGLSEKAATIWQEPGLGPWDNRLAAGDVDGDGLDDLAVGSPRAVVAGRDYAGLVRLLFGSADDVGGRNILLTQDTVGLARIAGDTDGAGAWEQFGDGLAIDDFNADGYGDLAIGAPGEGVPGSMCVESRGDPWCQGAVTIIPGSPAFGLDLISSFVLAQGFDGLLGASEPGDAFGRVLATGDLNDDGSADLAIGAPGESIDERCVPHESDEFVPPVGICAHGAVTVVYGSVDGLVPSSSARLSLLTPGIAHELNEIGHEQFGASLVVAPFGRSRAADLAIGIPQGTERWDGFVDVLYGTTSGVSGEGAQSWSQETPGVPGTSAAVDFFGFALAREVPAGPAGRCTTLRAGG